MRRLSPEEVKKIQIEILDVVAAFCEENKINYWLDSGTLLGAVRHKGYIPWDDDIDIGMLREDYDRFAELFNKSNDRYRFVDIYNTPDFYVAFGKIIDTRTLLYEPDEHGNKLSVNIDLFVYDDAPNSNLLVKKLYFTRDILRYIALFNKSDNIFETDSKKTRIKKRFLHIISKPFSRRKCLIKISKNAQKYNKLNTERVGNFTSITKIACSKELLKDFIFIEFEGKNYKVPVGYDEWLKSFYGDYLKLPPVEQRITHHRYKAYYL